MEASLKIQAELDDFGTLTEPYGENTPKYNFRALLAYCKKVGKEPSELTDDERERFRTN